MRFGIIDGQIEGLWSVVSDSGELSAAVTNYTITGLNGNVDCEYHLIARFVQGYDGAANYYAQLNSDTGNNYGYQYMTGIAAVTSAARGALNGLFFGGNAALGNIAMADMVLQAKSGFVRTAITSTTNSVATNVVSQVTKWAENWNNTADNITSMTIAASQTNGIGIGSRIILLKKSHNAIGMRTGKITPNKIVGCWERIYDNTLTEAANKISVTGIQGNTYPVYRVRMRCVDKDTIGNALLRFNDDSTADKYGYQALYASSSSAGAARGTLNGLYLHNTNIDDQVALDDMVLYVKSGFVRTALHNSVGQSSTTYVGTVSMWGQSYNDTSAEITSFDFIAPADYFEIGTHIEVDRLVLT